MALPNTLTNFTVFIDGVGYAGKVAEGQPPAIKAQTTEVMGGGMAAPVDVFNGAVEKLEFEITLVEFNPAAMGKFGADNLAVTFRGSQGNDATPVIIDTRALVREVDMGTFKPGDASQLKLAFTASYYKMTIDGDVIIEIDSDNMKVVTGGVDRTAGIRRALGV